jgi:hypothetical protein
MRLDELNAMVESIDLVTNKTTTTGTVRLNIQDHKGVVIGKLRASVMSGGESDIKGCIGEEPCKSATDL